VIRHELMAVMMPSHLGVQISQNLAILGMIIEIGFLASQRLGIMATTILGVPGYEFHRFTPDPFVRSRVSRTFSVALIG